MLTCGALRCGTFYSRFVFLVDDPPIVHYGTDSLLRLTARGTTTTYKNTDMCGTPASSQGFFSPGYIHDVLLTDLSPSSQYFYSYGSSKVG